MLLVTTLLAMVKKPGARIDWGWANGYSFTVSLFDLSLTWAKRPYLTSLRHTAWSSRLQSQPGMLSRRALRKNKDKLLFL